LVRAHNAGLAAFSCEEEGSQVPEVTVPSDFLKVFSVWVFFADGAKRRGRGEQDIRLMLGDDSPECACVWSADWFAFE
jgi:hypothetical protein